MALKKKHSCNPEAVSVTASTGMAASNIGGIDPFTGRNIRNPLPDVSP